MDYQEIEQQAIAHKEKNDCAVKAVALILDLSYADAHLLLKTHGRIDKRGTPESVIKKALESKNITIEERNISNYKTIKSIGKRLPAQKRFLIFTRKHVLAARNQQVHDWTRGRLHRPQRLWELSGDVFSPCTDHDKALEETLQIAREWKRQF